MGVRLARQLHFRPASISGLPVLLYCKQTAHSIVLRSNRDPSAHFISRPGYLKKKRVLRKSNSHYWATSETPPIRGPMREFPFREEPTSAADAIAIDRNTCDPFPTIAFVSSAQMSAGMNGRRQCQRFCPTAFPDNLTVRIRATTGLRTTFLRRAQTAAACHAAPGPRTFALLEISS
jgi:hypothetical protein